MNFKVVIPARYASTRLPGKPLLDIAGKPMVQHVYERALESGAAEVIIATDNDKVAQIARGFGAEVCMTAETHQSGTERLSEVIDKMGWGGSDIIVNLQGDEPLMSQALIHQVAQNLNEHNNASVATLSERIHSIEELFDPNVVKVTMDQMGMAIYFSRAPIPWARDSFAVSKDQLPENAKYYRHIGLYAYRADLVKRYVNWVACELESTESLEQLRVLWHGYKIHVAEAVEATAPGVDTPKDLEKVRFLLQ